MFRADNPETGHAIPRPRVAVTRTTQKGSLTNRALTVETGQTRVQRYLDPLLDHIENGDVDPSFVVTHQEPLERAPEMYQTFRDKEDGCVEVVLTP